MNQMKLAQKGRKNPGVNFGCLIFDGEYSTIVSISI